MQASNSRILETEFIVGGYYFIQGSKRQSWMNANLVPPFFWSASRCLCEKVPDAWIFPWNTNPDPCDERCMYQSVLGLNSAEFIELQSEFDKLHDLEEFGYPNVFMSRALAEDFYARYFFKLPNVKLISISLPKDEVEVFIQKNKLPQSVAENGITKKLRRYQNLETDGIFLGFEVLGFQYADFHSLICNSLDEEFTTNYKTIFNQFGLIDSYEDSISIIRDIRDGNLCVEDGYWASWLITEYVPNK